MRHKPIANGPKPLGAPASVAPKMTMMNTAVSTISVTNTAANE
ncbi:Uncharacterised protein [Mycobacteroides abscessus subsp. abscessus]|nr:Uncharacterised protein [Mycobacteroides abscessus subsp. abscessus]SKT99951.1 Uncharacterised protein [Mycobacteroides abscessus subsp. abscessus]